MVVIRDGTAVRVGERGCDPTELPSDNESPPEPVERFSRAEKKCRALHKKLREIEQLKARLQQGIELDAQQQASLGLTLPRGYPLS